MAIDIDVSQELRGTRDLQQLLDAVHDAGSNDESASIEWKSSLDLTTGPGIFHVARTILGFANRMPTDAAREFGGLAFLIVGLEPGSVEGVQSVDNAELQPRVDAYLGDEGPRWTPTELVHQDKTVLVVTVEAPTPGDRIHVLAKESPADPGKPGVPEGSVLVRRPGATHRANRAEMDRLQKRLLDRDTPPPDVSVHAKTPNGEPLDWYEPDQVAQAIAAFVEQKVSARRSAARVTDRRLHPDKYPGQRAIDDASLPLKTRSTLAHLEQIGAMHPLGSKPDDRDLNSYLEQLTKWSDDLTEQLGSQWSDLMINECRAVVCFEVNNGSDQNLENVEVRVRFDFDGLEGFDHWDKPKLPKPPRPYGERTKLAATLMKGQHLDYPKFVSMTDAPAPGRSHRIEDGSVVAVFSLGHLYPQRGDDSDDFGFVLSARPGAGALKGEWEVRAKNLNSVVRGTLEVPVGDEPVNPQHLLDLVGDPSSSSER